MLATWSVTQPGQALSSGEAEFYAMVEAVIKGKWLRGLASELGWGELGSVIKVRTDSEAARSFVSRRGLGRMRHLEIRDLW